jgi:hypothetical protein
LRTIPEATYHGSQISAKNSLENKERKLKNTLLLLMALSTFSVNAQELICKGPKPTPTPGHTRRVTDTYMPLELVLDLSKSTVKLFHELKYEGGGWPPFNQAVKAKLVEHNDSTQAFRTFDLINQKGKFIGELNLENETGTFTYPDGDYRDLKCRL